MDNNQGQPSQAVLDHLFDKRGDQNVLKGFNSIYGVGAAEKYLNETASATLKDEALVIPQAEVDLLIENRDNPAYSRVFNKRHGAGHAERVLQTKTPQEPQEPEDNRSDRSYSADMAIGVAAGLEDVVVGTLKFGDWVTDNLFGTGPRIVWGDGNGLRIISGQEFEEAKAQGLVNEDNFDVVPDAETGIGSFVQGVTTFAVPYFGMFGKVAKSGKIFQGLMAGAVVDGVVINPDDANLTGALEQMGADMGIVTDLLATDPDDPEWMNRARNMAEGGVLGLALESIFYGLKATKAQKSGDLEAAQEFLDKAQELSRGIDGEIDAVAKAAADDAQETLDMAGKIFPKADGENIAEEAVPTKPQGEVEIQAATKVPFRMTEEQVESVKRLALIAETDPQAAAKEMKLSFNSVDTMNDFDDVLAQLAAHKHVMEKEFLAARGGNVQSWSTVQGQVSQKLRYMADILGKDSEEFLAEITGGIKVPPHELAAEIVSKARMYQMIELEIADLLEGIKAGNVKGYASLDEAKLALRSRFEIAANLGSVVDANRANVGRALAAMKMTKSADPKIREMIKKSLYNSDIDALIRAASDSDQPLKTVLEANSTFQTVMDNVNHFRINALLSGPGTQEVNLIGTAVNSVMIPLQQIMGGEVKHGARTLAYQLASSLDALKMAKNAFVKDESILDVLSTKFDMQEDLAKGKKGPARAVISAPSRFLLAMDEFFKQSTYRGRVMADAAMEADLLKLNGQKREDFINKYLRESFDVKGGASRGEALLQSQRSTFTELLEPNSFGAWVQSGGRGKGVAPAMVRFVLPFVRTPMNILSQSFQNMPLIQHSSKRFRDDLHGSDPIRKAQAIGKIVTAYSLLGLGWFLSGRGDFTGSGPTDPRIRKEWLANNQPYSIKITREDGSFYWFSYQRYEPLANVLSVIADLNEIVSDPYNEKETGNTNVVAATLLALAENTVNKTFTQGLSDFFELLVGDPYTREKSLQGMIGSFVPNILNQTNGDMAFRETRTFIDPLLARTGLFNELDPKRNVLGEITLRPNLKYEPLGISNIGNYREVDPVLEEITRVSMKDGSAFSMFTGSIYLNENTNLKDIPYQDGPQSMYDKIMELTGTTKIRGKTLRETLQEIFESEAYQKDLIDGTKGVNNSGTKGQYVNKVIGTFRKKAMSEIPEYKELLEKSQISQNTTNTKELIKQRPELAGRADRLFEKFNELFPEQ